MSFVSLFIRRTRYAENGTTKRRARRAKSAPSRLIPEAGGRGWLVAQGLKKAYRGRKVVHDASIAVARGEAVGLLGPNGAGKTTIFYMITGLVRADAGTVELDGHNVTGMPMYRRARLGIGYLPQEASIFRGLSVEQNIRAVLEVVEPDRRNREDSTVAARSSCSGTVCSPAIIMIMAKGNSRQMFTTISDGRTVLTLSMKFGGRSTIPSCRGPRR